MDIDFKTISAKIIKLRNAICWWGNLPNIDKKNVFSLDYYLIYDYPPATTNRSGKKEGSFLDNESNMNQPLT